MYLLKSSSWKLTRLIRGVKRLLTQRGFVKQLAFTTALRFYRAVPLPRGVRQRLKTRAMSRRVMSVVHEVHRNSFNKIADNGMPVVSVIVPNYNHEKFLRQRLESIYNQTYQNFEVILLDDCSTDDSRKILDEFKDRFPDKTVSIFNEKNSGSPFHQWALGIKKARGQIVWIAESDDFCDDDLLERTLSAFNDECVQIAYCDIQFVDADSNILYGLDDYRRSTGYDLWNKPYVHSSRSQFWGAFGIKNIIPNSSGTIFRRPFLSQEFVDYLATFRVCGDWIFYMHIARGGKIAYVPYSRCYFRQHATNTSVSSLATEKYYQEHHDVAVNLIKYYAVPREIIEGNFRGVEKTYNQHFTDENNQFSLPDAYDLSVVFQTRKERLNILISTLGFYLGGGEILPIHLANALYRMGHTVTFFALGFDAPEEEGVRLMLDTGIPVLRPPNFDANKNLISDYGFDIINSHNIALEYFFMELGIAEKKGVSYIVSHHGSYDLSQALPQQLRTFNGFVDHWFYLAEKNLATLREAKGIALDNITKIPNGLPPMEPGKDLPSRKDLDIPDGSFVCAIITRALTEKGWHQAIEAVERANKKAGQGVYLLLVGNGPVYDRMKEGTLSPFVRLLGYKNNAAQFYHLADVGLLPSYFSGESFPLTLIECLQAHKPCIATDIGEIRNMLTDDSGKIAGAVIQKRSDDEGLIDELSQAIVKFALDKDHYSNLCKISVLLSQNYHIENVAKTYEKKFWQAFSKNA